MMQNHDSNHKSTGFWTTKGYYMLLGLCAVAVAVSGYVFLRDAAQEQEEVAESLSAPLIAEVPEELPVSTELETATEPQAGDEVSEPVQSILPETVMPVSGIVIQEYAMDRLTYDPTTRDWRVHNGVDLSAALGQEVRAARAGTVTAVYEDDSYGVTVVVQHENGYTSHYAGLAAGPAVAVGDTVSAGQTLGAIGGTARIESAQEPHLHFEVYCNGESIDPAGFLY